MSLVLIVLAIGLAFAAFRTKHDAFTRGFLIACCIGNLALALTWIARDDPKAFGLMPNDGSSEADYRPDRR